MVEYLCERCDYCTSKTTDIRKHLQRINACVDKNNSGKSPQELLDQLAVKGNKTYKCKYCDKVYKSIQGRYLHVKRHHGDKVSDALKSDMTIITTASEIEAIIKRYIKEHPQVVNITTNNISNQTNNNIQQQQNINQQNISIRAHEDENRDYLFEDKDKMSRLFLNRMTGFKRLAELLHCDPKHPENHNVKVTNKKSPFIHIHDGNQWRQVPKNEGLDMIINNIKNIVDEFLEYHDGKILVQEKATSREEHDRAQSFYDVLKLSLSHDNDKKLDEHERKLLKDMRTNIYSIFINFNIEDL